MFVSLFKEINRVIKKGRSNIYLNVTIERTWYYQNFVFTKV